MRPSSPSPSRQAAHSRSADFSPQRSARTLKTTSRAPPPSQRGNSLHPQDVAHRKRPHHDTPTVSITVSEDNPVRQSLLQVIDRVFQVLRIGSVDRLLDHAQALAEQAVILRSHHVEPRVLCLLPISCGVPFLHRPSRFLRSQSAGLPESAGAFPVLMVVPRRLFGRLLVDSPHPHLDTTN